MDLKKINNEYLTTLAELTEQKNLVELKLQELNKNFCENLTNFIGKCFDASEDTYEYVLAKSDYWRTYITKLHKVCQVIGTKNNLLIIQEFKEKINEVQPKKRLTFECKIYPISLNEFASMYQQEIDISNYLLTIKTMQNRDSYRCWHTSINLSI